MATTRASAKGAAQQAANAPAIASATTAVTTTSSTVGKASSPAFPRFSSPFSGSKSPSSAAAAGVPVPAIAFAAAAPAAPTLLSADVFWVAAQTSDRYRFNLLSTFPPLRTLLRSRLWPDAINFKFTAYVYPLVVALLLWGPQVCEYAFCVSKVEQLHMCEGYVRGCVRPCVEGRGEGRGGYYTMPCPSTKVTVLLTSHCYGQLPEPMPGPCTATWHSHVHELALSAPSNNIARSSQL